MRPNRSIGSNAQSGTILVLIATLGVASGCDKGGIDTYPVVGTVLIDSRPADGAMVVFVPTSTSEEAERKRPFGIANGEGRFSLTTLVEEDGAPAGEYKVLIQWPMPSKPDDQRVGRRGALGPDRLRGKYFNLEKSVLTATVKEESNELPPFELSSK
jgi:hypothetical protein